VRRVQSVCFHCGEALPDGAPIFANLGQVHQPVCCVGCLAVAEFIHRSGFDTFYEHRLAPQAELGLRVEPSEWGLYDDEELLQRYVHRRAEWAEARLEIGGMYCSACVWLLENALNQVAGIINLTVNPATRRAVIRWDSAQLLFSEVLTAIATVGFKPAPMGVGSADRANVNEQRLALRRLVVAIAAGMQVMMFAAGLYAGNYYGIEPGMERFLRFISLIVAVPIVLYAARPFFAAAIRGLRARMPSMDLPVAIAIGAAFMASAWATLTNHGEVYFDSIAMFVMFLTATRYLEMRARHRSDDAVEALARLLPETVTRIRGGEAEVVPITRLGVGDVVVIRPGDVIPADGDIHSGHLSMDESMLTGEALPVYRTAGMEVHAGGINRSGNGTIKVRLIGANTGLAEIGRLIERASADRPPIARLADMIASKFVVGVLGVSIITAVVWWQTDPSRAFEVVLATLVVTCPCALALATPAALAAAASRLARDGFLLVRSRILEVLKGKATYVFDKTGTLTRGRPTICDVDLFGSASDGDHDHYLALTAAIETASEHVLARAFAPFYNSSQFDIDEVCITTGAGIKATVNGKSYRVGSLSFVNRGSTASQAEYSSGSASTTVFLGDNAGACARFRITDELRDDAASTVQRLQALGNRVIIASGDRPAAVRSVARQLKVENWYADMSPTGKMALVASLQEAGETVVMVGDGINDAPVLQSADASIAIDAGTALARASADAVALGQRLGCVVDAVATAGRVNRIIRQNVTWAIAYNITAVPLAVTGVLSPWMAALGMSVSSLVVVLNALRLQRGKLARIPDEQQSAPVESTTEVAA
jgi:Cu2+-exporting ATPase